MTQRKFYRTLVSIEMLTEEPLSGNLSLADIEYEFTEGHASAGAMKYHTTVLNGVEAAAALEAQGSDPEFFGLDKDGNDIVE